MCMVSAVHQQIGPLIPTVTPGFPGWVPPNAAPNVPDYSKLFPKPDLTPEILKLVKECLEKLDRLDKHFGLKDCSVEATKKADFAAKIDKLIADAEALKGA